MLKIIFDADHYVKNVIHWKKVLITELPITMLDVIFIMIIDRWIDSINNPRSFLHLFSFIQIVYMSMKEDTASSSKVWDIKKDEL